jgi:hypothetical protein
VADVDQVREKEERGDEFLRACPVANEPDRNAEGGPNAYEELSRQRGHVQSGASDRFRHRRGRRSFTIGMPRRTALRSSRRVEDVEVHRHGITEVRNSTSSSLEDDDASRAGVVPTHSNVPVST